jgi:hypothetical protein
MTVPITGAGPAARTVTSPAAAAHAAALKTIAAAEPDVAEACPTVLGGPLPHVMAAEAVAFAEARPPSTRFGVPVLVCPSRKSFLRTLTVFGAIASQSLKSLPLRGEPDQPAEVAEPCQ